jgi:hypothetical protein
MLPILLLPAASILIGSVSAVPVSDQQPLGDRLWHFNEDTYNIDSRAGSSSPRGLTGRFLHITGKTLFKVRAEEQSKVDQANIGQTYIQIRTTKPENP